MRQTNSRIVSGILSWQLPKRNLSSIGTASIKGFVNNTPNLTTQEQNVVKAFIALLGRSPDTSGLSFWAVQSSASSVTTAVNALVTSLSGSLVYDSDPGVTAQMLCQNLLGITLLEDSTSINYWRDIISSTSVGNAVTGIINAYQSATGFVGDTYRNRILTANSVCRLQKTYSRDINLADSRVVAARVDARLSNYEAAMSDIYKILVDNTALPTNTWGNLTDSKTLWSESRFIDNSPVRQSRSLVWYNREGRMMRAVAYLPPNFLSGTHRAIIALHGGGWRLGWPEQVEWMSTYLSNLTGQSYIVISPTYRLTPFGGSTPGMENDVADILSLVKTNSSIFRCDSSKVGLIGESAGAHLAALVGSTQDVWRVFGLYPPINLTGTPAVSTGLDPYVNYYADTSLKRQNASPQFRWTGPRTGTGVISGALATMPVYISSLSAATGYLDITATKSGYSNITLRFNITRVLEAVDGSQPKLVTLTGPRSILYNTAGNTPVPSTINFTATGKYVASGTYFYRFKVDGVVLGSIIASSTGTAISSPYNVPTNYFSTAKTISVEISTTSTMTNIIDTDSMSFVSTRSGTADIGAYLTNPTYDLLANSSGTIYASEFGEAYTNFVILEGGVESTGWTYYVSGISSGITYTVIPTKFNLWHGTSDTFVPSSQSTNFDSLVGANCEVTLVSGEGHGFTPPAKATAMAAAGTWFALY
jgi:acetyl esterase/lipase